MSSLTSAVRSIPGAWSLVVTKASDFWWCQCSSRWRLRNVPILVVQHKQSLEKTSKRFGGGQEMWKWTVTCAVPCLAVWSSISLHPLARLRASSSRTWWVCASGREHGTYCERWRFIVFLTVARAGCPHAAATISAALDGCRSMPNSCIRELGENPMGCLLWSW